MKAYFKTAGKIALGTFVASTLAACSYFHPELDRPVETGNTMDQFNSLEKHAPIYTNVNISYEFEYVAHQNSEEKGQEFWLYKGRLDDMTNRFIQMSYAEIEEDQRPPAGAVITQGRKRITGYDTCVSKTREMTEDVADFYGDAVNNLDTYVLDANAPKTDLFVRRFIENDTPENARRLEAVYYVSLDELGYSCDSLNVNDGEIQEMLAEWRAEALRSFEIIG